MRLFYPFFIFFCLALSIDASAQIPSYVPTTGLAAWYPFSGNAGDSSGNGNTVSVNGPTLTTDRFGNTNRAYSFNGSSDYMKISTTSTSALNMRNGFSISAWFKTNWNFATHDMMIFWRGDQQFATDPYMIYVNTAGNAVLRRDVNSGTTQNLITYTLSGADTGTFHHFVGTYDTLSDFMTIYFDGVPVTQTVLSGTVLYNTNTFFNMIGATDNGSTLNFKGTLDDIGIWTRELTQCEVTQLYYATSKSFSKQPSNAVAKVGTVASFSVTDVNPFSTYQWQRYNGTTYVNLSNGSPYSGVFTTTLVINPVSTALNNAEYRCVRSGGGCVENSSPATLMTTANAVSTQSGKESLFSIYPNPNDGRFTLNTGNQTGKRVSVELLDMTGRVVFHDQYEHVPEIISLDFGDKLATGVYALKVNADGEQQALMFLKK